MTLEDIDATLPNGFHDLLVEQLSIDFVNRIANFEVSVWTGNLEAPAGPDREARRRAVLTLHGLQFCVLEPPDPKYRYAKPESIWLVDLLEADPALSGRYSLPPEVFSSRFFVNQWNAFVHVAAQRATLDWK